MYPIKSLAATGLLLAAPLSFAHQIQPDDYFSIAGFSEQQLSPDGSQLAWIEYRWNEQLNRTQKDIWLKPVKGGEATRLTFSSSTESALQWAKDGSILYYLAAVEGKKQVHRLMLNSLTIQPVTAVAEGIKQYQLNHKGDALYYSSYSEPAASDPFAEVRSKYNTPDYGEGKRKSNPIYRLDLTSFRQQPVYAPDATVWNFQVSPDEQQLAAITTHTARLIELEGFSDIRIVDLKTEQATTLNDSLWREQADSPHGWLEGIQWSADSQALAFRVDYDGYPGKLIVAETDSQQPRLQAISAPSPVTFNGGDIEWRGKSRELCLRGSNHARIHLYCVDKVKQGKHGKWRNATPGDVVAYSFDISANGKTTLVQHNALDRFAELYQVKGKQLKRLTDSNSHTQEWQLPQIEIVKWQSEDGTQVEGILELPPGYSPADGPLPLVVALHGGPTSADPYALRLRSYGHASFPAQGWALFSPNYRGSVGYGDSFLTDLIGREHDIEVKDILTGVDALIAKGIADADKMAVMGWSNGGYLTNALISTTDRFKAASSGAGVFDQGLQFALEDTPGHVVNFMQGYPWTQGEHYLKASSLYQADKIKTPTLIHVGENDARVPAAHARTLYRVLHDYLQVPSELIVYPGEGHGLSKYQHRKTKMAWDHAWFDYWVLGKGRDKE